MKRGATGAATQQGAAPDLLARLTAAAGWLGPRGQLPLIGVSAALAIGLGTVAVAVDATPEQLGAHWLGSLEAPPSGKTTRLLSAVAVGLGAEVRRVEADRDRELRALRAQLHALGARQTLLQDRLRSIDRGSAQQGGASYSIAALAERPAGKISAAAGISAIKAEAPGLEEEVRGLRLVAAGLLLREGAQSAGPFEPALERFAMVAAAVQSAELEADPVSVAERIALLRPYAKTGVVSTRDLRRSFAALTVMVDRAVPSSWWDRALVMAGLRDDPSQPLQDAQAALMVDDLEGAVASLATLQGEAALVTEGWLGLAQARLATDAVVDDLYRLALAVGAGPFAAGAAVASSGKVAPPRRSPRPAPWQAAQTAPANGSWSR